MAILALPGQAQKYHDALIQEAKGNVKSINSGGWLYEYGSDGALKKILQGKGEIFFDITRNPSSRYVETFTVYQDGNRAEALYKNVYEYKGGLVSSYACIALGGMFRELLGDSSVEFYYGNGLCTGSKSESGAGIVVEYVYDNIKVDNNGNWISRDIYNLLDGEKTFQQTETREITYWN